MDGASVTQIILGVLAILGGSGGLFSLYTVIIKANSQIKVDDATLIRSNLIPTSEWLKRERELNDRLTAMDEKIDAQRDMYETKIAEKDRIILNLNIEIEKLKDELRDVRHRVGNVEQAEQFRKEGLAH